MPLEAYIPSKVALEGQPVSSPILITLYEPDGGSPTGSLTAGAPLAEGRSGRLIFEGDRDGKTWSVVLPRITVTHKSAVGCEFTIQGEIERTVLMDLEQDQKLHEKAFEEQFDIR